MNRTLLIIYEPALFLLVALGWAGWELWSVRTRKADRTRRPDTPSPSPSEPPTGTRE